MVSLSKLFEDIYSIARPPRLASQYLALDHVDLYICIVCHADSLKGAVTINGLHYRIVSFRVLRRTLS